MKNSRPNLVCFLCNLAWCFTALSCSPSKDEQVKKDSGKGKVIRTAPSESSRAERLKSARSPFGAQADKKGGDDRSKDGDVNPVSELARLTSRPPVVRFSTEGLVRYVIELPDEVSNMVWSAHKGMTVSSGRWLHNITSKGLDRWKLKAGRGHHVYSADGKEIVWSDEFRSLFQVLRHGRIGWKRDWKNKPVQSDGKEVYLVDAASIALLGGDGEDKWRVTVEGMRDMEGPFPCGKRVLFQGRRGKRSAAVEISASGAILKKRSLPEVSVLLGASSECEPVVWSKGEVFLLESGVLPKWSHEFDAIPGLSRIEDGYILIVQNHREPVRVVLLDSEGAKRSDLELQLTGRLSGEEVFLTEERLVVAGMCKDVSSPCTKAGGSRGPFNVIVTGLGDNFTVLERTVSGHMHFVLLKDNGFITAVSKEGDRTVLTKRDGKGRYLWSSLLPGRLTAGPVVGPYGAVYLATCKSWDCRPPFRFISVTAVATDRGE